MSSLINRIQRAFLGSAGAEKVRALLTELAIPTGGEGGTVRAVRNQMLRPVSGESVLRDALAALGAEGGGGGDKEQAVYDIRQAVLRNLRDSNAVLLAGLNDLMEPGDFAGGDEDMALITSGTISSAVDKLDLTLPTGYTRYKLLLTELVITSQASNNDFLAFAFSQDGGTSYLDDTDGYAGYTLRGIKIDKSEGSAQPEFKLSSDAIGYMLFGVSAEFHGDGPVCIEANIFPGSASIAAAIQAKTISLNSADSSGFTDFCDSICRMNTARVNKIRIQPYGNGDANPPTSGHTLASGTYHLYGYPAP